MDQRNYKTFSGARRLFQLLPEPFHGEHMQAPDRFPQGDILLYKKFRGKLQIIFQDIRFNQIRALLDYMYHGEVSKQNYQEKTKPKQRQKQPKK